MQAITKHLDYIFSALNNNESVLLVMLDISKAYTVLITRYFWKSLKTQESGATHYIALTWILLIKQGAKVDINDTF